MDGSGDKGIMGRGEPPPPDDLMRVSDRTWREFRGGGRLALREVTHNLQFCSKEYAEISAYG